MVRSLANWNSRYVPADSVLPPTRLGGCTSGPNTISYLRNALAWCPHRLNDDLCGFATTLDMIRSCDTSSGGGSLGGKAGVGTLGAVRSTSAGSMAWS